MLGPFETLVPVTKLYHHYISNRTEGEGITAGKLYGVTAFKVHAHACVLHAIAVPHVHRLNKHSRIVQCFDRYFRLLTGE